MPSAETISLGKYPQVTHQRPRLEPAVVLKDRGRGRKLQEGPDCEGVLDVGGPGENRFRARSFDWPPPNVVHSRKFQRIQPALDWGTTGRKGRPGDGKKIIGPLGR